MLSRSITSSRIPLNLYSRLSCCISIHSAPAAASFSSNGTRLFSTGTALLSKQSSPSGPEPAKKKLGFWETQGRRSYNSLLNFIDSAEDLVYNFDYPNNIKPVVTRKKNLVILGTGWGSISLLKSIDASKYNIVVASPRNFFLFTPLLPSCTTGTVEHRSIMEPVRNIIKKKGSTVTYYEANATKIDCNSRKVIIQDTINKQEKILDYDYLVLGVGAQSSTFGIPHVQEHANFLKEISDAQKIRKRIMDCVETASFLDKDDPERQRLLQTVVVGGGPTGVEFAAELHDFFEEDLKKWVPDIAKDFKVTLVESLPNVLPSFSKELVQYTEKTMKAEEITVLTKTMVKKVDEKIVTAEKTNSDGSKEVVELSYGLLVWATGNTARPVIQDVISSVNGQKYSHRGIVIDDRLAAEGMTGVWALGDCTDSKYAQTAQVAAQQGAYLSALFNRIAKSKRIKAEMEKYQKLANAAKEDSSRSAATGRLRSKTRRLARTDIIVPFEYTHQGSLAYIGSDKAVADISVFTDKWSFSVGGYLTYLFWRSAYLSMVFGARNKFLVLIDWLKVKMFGRDVSRE